MSPYSNQTFTISNPQNPAPQGNSSTFDDAYRDCVSKLGNAPGPGLVAAASVIQISQTTGVDPTLFSVTWYEESRFRYFPENGRHGGGDADIGPGQVHPGTWDKAPYTSGLRNPFGTNRAVGQVFNGNPIENLLLSAYALDSRAGSRAKKAGLYKAGQVGGDGYQTRVNNFNKNAKVYDDFFNCLARRGFRAP